MTLEDRSGLQDSGCEVPMLVLDPGRLLETEGWIPRKKVVSLSDYAELYRCHGDQTTL